jgi:DNA/RNA-binding domain of Phe-tRNA-synthetase-like protein
VTHYAVADEVAAAYKDFRIEVVLAEGLAGRQAWPEVERRLAALEAGPAPAWGEDDPHIAAWHAAYRAFGTNPRRERPSVDALRRRLARTGRLPRISPAVDCYNLISATYGMPAGAFDLSAVTGDIVIRFARGDEEFTPLGEPGTVERPRPGEVIYTDSGGVLTRHWNHRDAERTKVGAGSDPIVYMLETVAAAEFGDVMEAGAGELAALLAARCARVTRHVLTAAAPAVDLQVA